MNNFPLFLNFDPLTLLFQSGIVKLYYFPNIMNPVDLFYLQNPWRKNSKFQVTPFFERTVLHKIESWLDEPEITVLIGPRQSGKTTILI